MCLEANTIALDITYDILNYRLNLGDWFLHLSFAMLMLVRHL